MEPNYFHEKGKVAEEYIAKLCSNAFQYDFCFKNPYIDDKELCDVLIILQNKAIIWQIKNIKNKNGQINNNEVDKAIRQCLGAKRKLISKSKIEMVNIRNESKTINCTNITDYYLIVAIEGALPNSYGTYTKQKGSSINIFFAPFTRFAIKYLNSVPDLVDYLDKKEIFLENLNLNILGGEENLLAYFLSNARSFGELEGTNYDFINFDTREIAKKFEERPEVKTRLAEEKKYCAIVDELIEIRRNSIPLDPNIIIPQDTTDFIISIFLNMTSLEKRVMGKMFYECSLKAREVYKIKKNESKFISYRDYYINRKVLYILGFIGDNSNKGREMRKLDLMMASYGAIKKLDYDFDYVLGIGTDINFSNNPTNNFEWLFLDYTNKELVNKDIDNRFPDLNYFLEGFGILKNQSVHFFDEKEYESTNFLLSKDFYIIK